jgi:hypothetical protein
LGFVAVWNLECRCPFFPLLLGHIELRELVARLGDLLLVQAACLDGPLQVLPSFVVFLLGVRDIERDLLDLAALVGAQLLEIQSADRRLRLGVFLHV